MNRKQVYINEDGKGMLSRKAKVADPQKKMPGANSSAAKTKSPNTRASFTVMNSYSTASLPKATVTQNWNIDEAMRSSENFYGDR